MKSNAFRSMPTARHGKAAFLIVLVQSEVKSKGNNAGWPCALGDSRDDDDDDNNNKQGPLQQRPSGQHFITVTQSQQQGGSQTTSRRVAGEEDRPSQHGGNGRLHRATLVGPLVVAAHEQVSLGGEVVVESTR